MKKVQIIKTEKEGGAAHDVSGFKKVYKHKDLEKIFNADKHKEDTEKYCENLVQETQKKCEQLEKDLRVKYEKLFSEQQVEMASKIESKLRSFFQNVEKEIFNITTQVVTKLGADLPPSTKIFNLIRDKINSTISENLKMSVLANQKTLLFLREQIESHFPESNNLTFAVKDDLRDDECILETDYIYVKVDINQYFDEFSKIVSSLSKPVAHLSHGTQS